MLKTVSFALGLLAVLASPLWAQPDPRDWEAVERAAKGQTVYWHAWGGSPRINDYIAEIGATVSARYGVTVEHVKLSDTADAVSRVIAEKAAGRTGDGAVDMIWINGENFAAMKAQSLLFGPWAEDVPNWPLVDADGKAALTLDFAVPTDGLEAPWGSAQLIFFHETARAPNPPRSMEALLEWAKANPGRFAFSQPPDFMGSTFLKQALHEMIPDPALLTAPPGDEFEAATAPLWSFMEALTPHLWRGGAAYPQTGPQLIQLMGDGEIDLSISFSSGEISAAIESFELPETVRSYTLTNGTIGNAHFVAIPFNATAKEGAMVLANYLMSPEAQARKTDPSVWGDSTVLDVAALSPADQALFSSIDLGPATLGPDALGIALPEPHADWMPKVEEEWRKRFGVAE